MYIKYIRVCVYSQAYGYNIKPSYFLIILMSFPECQPDSVVEKSTEVMGKEISLIQFHQICCLAFLELL